MVIVAGHITVEPEQRESYSRGGVSVVEQARGTAGCLGRPRAASTSLSDGSRMRLSKPSAAAAHATSKAGQCSRRR